MQSWWFSNTSLDEIGIGLIWWLIDAKETTVQWIIKVILKSTLNTWLNEQLKSNSDVLLQWMHQVRIRCLNDC